MNLPNFYVDDIIKSCIKEDINYLDLASDYLLSDEDISSAKFVAKADGVLCGIEIALRVFTLVDEKISTETFYKDGDKISVGDIIATVKGPAKSMLKAERTSLNLLQHLSGIATETAKYVEKCEGTKASVADTRKTMPMIRAMQKYAVTVGGGRNHRFNLSDAAMLKDNHIDAYGSITGAVNALRSKVGHMVKIEVEVRDKTEFLEALACKADVIMLDNMTIAEMTECVEISPDRTALLEASGNVSLETIGEIAKTGVDIISIGALTHSVKAFDISLKFDK